MRQCDNNATVGLLSHLNAVPARLLGNATNAQAEKTISKK
jgi:hypothetical protein